MNEISYKLPKVELLNVTPLWPAEIAARTAYQSFDKSEHKAIRNYPKVGYVYPDMDIPSSKILTSLAWVQHHHSVLEMIDLTFSIKETSRGVLQEHARHRIQSLTVQSTRYTMSNVLNAYLAASIPWRSVSEKTAKGVFNKLIKELDIFIFDNSRMHEIECDAMYEKLKILGEYDMMLSNEGKEVLSRWRDLGDNLFEELQRAKKKRNVGDRFKSIVTDNWKVDMIVKFNLRSLKNYFNLRDSNAAYFQIRTLAKQMKLVIPSKYLDLIVKNNK